MKRKIYTGAILLAIAATAAWNTSVGSKADSMLSDAALANIEALADTEGVDCSKIGLGSCTVGDKITDDQYYADPYFWELAGFYEDTYCGDCETAFVCGRLGCC